MDFDFSDVMIDGMTLENFLELGEVDDDFKDWNDFVNFIKRRFLAGINSDTYKFVKGMVFFTGESETDFSIRVSPAMMNIDGKYIINYSLVDNATGEVLGTAYQTGDGGTFGSFSNLQGDGFEEAAEAFKKILNKQFFMRRLFQYYVSLSANLIIHTAYMPENHKSFVQAGTQAQE